MPSAYDLCALAWGDHTGYVFLSIRDPSLKQGDAGYWKDLGFRWPDEQSRVNAALKKSQQSFKDVYWAPAVYSEKRRAKEVVQPTNLLWADLDEAAPHNIPGHLKPTAAWQTSPGRYQAIWKLDTTLTPEVQTELNKRLTYAIGADKGGWDLTQVLRIPDTPNHKYPDEPRVTLEYMNGRVANAIQVLNDLPEATRGPTETEVAAGSEIPDRNLLLRRLRLPGRAKALLRVRPGQESGDRSERLWELECLLAEVGCTEGEIVSLVRPTGWNKFSDRADEIKRLFTEARKAIVHSGPVKRPTVSDSLTALAEQDVWDEEEDARPLTWSEFDKDHKKIQWIVDEVWGKSEVGFISGLPKSYKSWLALDLAVSVATGTTFLGHFKTHHARVLLIQEEDPKVVMQDRLVKIAAAKGLIHAELLDRTHIDFRYQLPDDLFIVSNAGFTLNEEWLEQLVTWITDLDIDLVILDPLMMMAEGVDEFKALEMMNGVLKPLKRLRAKTDTGIVVVHHHTKGTQASGAQAMYGSVALWAWEEAGLHLSVPGPRQILAERFSKHTLLPPIGIAISDTQEGWAPEVGTPTTTDLIDVLGENEFGMSVTDIEEKTGMKSDTIRRHLKRLEEEERIEKIGKKWKVKRGVS